MVVKFSINHYILGCIKRLHMAGMFSCCKSFNQPLDDWDVSNVECMYGMFDGCKSFNQPLNNWEVFNVTDMNHMFAGCKSFNQPLCDWDVSNVDSMDGMFRCCTSFNQPLVIGMFLMLLILIWMMSFMNVT